MLDSSITSRFAVSFASNLIRGVLTFVTVVLLGRLLGPREYGNLTFLMGSFIGVKQLLDLGTSDAFYTFISQKKRGLGFIKIYTFWQLFQFFVALTAIGLLFSDNLIEKIWLGQNKELILLAFIATYFKEQAWTTIVHIGESLRSTFKVQASNLFIAIIHFLLILVVWKLNILSLKLLFTLVFLEYFFAVIIGIRFFEIHKLSNEIIAKKSIYQEYSKYCTPLIPYAVLSFVYVFADRWMLQHYSGPIEQGYYGVGYQFSIVILLATTSFLKIFWKEIAEAKQNENLQQIEKLYKKICRFLFMVGAISAGLVIPWSEEIIRLTLGASYMAGSPTLALMFIFPIHTSLSQITATLLFASGRTKAVVTLQSIVMAISLPVTYFVLASPNAAVPGLGLGSLGVAFKMVIIQIIGVNFITWWVSRDHGWKFDWIYQITNLSGALLFGFLAFGTTTLVSQTIQINLLFKVVIGFLVYVAFIVVWLWSFPQLAGMTKQEIKNRLSHIFLFSKK